MLHRASRSFIALALTVLLLAGCGGGNDQTKEDIGWASWGNVAENTHFALLHQVDGENVKELRVAWTDPAARGRAPGRPSRPWSGYDTGLDQVFAVDAATGNVRWTYTPPPNFLAGPGLELLEPVSRGVTFGAGKIFVITADDQLIALDAGTGKGKWKMRVVDPERATR
jgi:glucose dehydrogenase